MRRGSINGLRVGTSPPILTSGKRSCAVHRRSSKFPRIAYGPRRCRTGADACAGSSAARLTEKLRHTSHQEKVSLFTIFAAALNTMLYRYTGSDDILLGIPLADRDQQELQSVIGFLLHTHVLRTRIAGDMSFRELLVAVQKGALELYAHRAAPFDQIVRRLGQERNQGYTPLFQVMLNWRDRDQQLSFIGLEGLAVESLMAHSNTAKFDLLLFATDEGDEIWLEMEYNADLFDEDRVQRMLGHYQAVLESATSDPAQTVSHLEILPAAEYRKVVYEWNATAAPYHSDTFVHRLIEAQAARTPDGDGTWCLKMRR